MRTPLDRVCPGAKLGANTPPATILIDKLRFIYKIIDFFSQKLGYKIGLQNIWKKMHFMDSHFMTYNCYKIYLIQTLLDILLDWFQASQKG